MKVSYSSGIAFWAFTVFSILERTNTANAFVITPPTIRTQSSPPPPTTTSSSLFVHSIKGAGCGVPLVPSGDRLLFDPSQEGMLSGTESLNQRINQGSTYVYLAEHQGPSFASPQLAPQSCRHLCVHL